MLLRYKELQAELHEVDNVPEHTLKIELKLLGSITV